MALRRSRLRIGTPAPDFTAPTASGESFTLSDHRGAKVWLAFFRYASCPMCNLRVADIIQRYDALTAGGLVVAGVLQSTPERIAEFVGKQGPPFPLICDPGERLYKMYGLEASLRGYAHPANGIVLAQAASRGFVPSRKMDGTKTRHPADFLIDAAGQLVDVFYADKISAHIPFDRVERFVG